MQNKDYAHMKCMKGTNANSSVFITYQLGYKQRTVFKTNGACVNEIRT